MAEKARTMPGPRGRGPRPKLDHPGQTLGRVLKYVGRKYWLHLIFVVVSIFVSVFAMVQGTLFTKTLIDSYILPWSSRSRPGRQRISPASCTPSPAWPCSTPAA